MKHALASHLFAHALCDEGNRRKDDDDRNDGDRRNDDHDDAARRIIKGAHAVFATEVSMAIAKFEAAQAEALRSSSMPPPSAVPQRSRKRQRDEPSLSSQRTALVYEHAKAVHLEMWAQQTAANLLRTARQAKETARTTKTCVELLNADELSVTNAAVPRSINV